jgi:serine protease Do
VSAVSRTLSDGTNHTDLLQTDAAINIGNSGGPLLNIHGEVIGLMSAMRGNAQNIGFAIPVEIVDQVATTLIKNGSATKPYVMDRPYMGFYMNDLDNRIMNNPGLPKEKRGVVVIRVVPRSPAEKCGIKVGDFITTVAGAPANGVKEVRAVVGQHKPGDALDIAIIRNGQNVVKKLTLDKYPEDEPWANR